MVEQEAAQFLLIKHLGTALECYHQKTGEIPAVRLKEWENTINFVELFKQHYQQRDQWLGYTQLPTKEALVDLACGEPYTLKTEASIQLLDWAIELSWGV
jgi:hypothetical protein